MRIEKKGNIWVVRRRWWSYRTLIIYSSIAISGILAYLGVESSILETVIVIVLGLAASDKGVDGNNELTSAGFDVLLTEEKHSLIKVLNECSPETVGYRPALERLKEIENLEDRKRLKALIMKK